MAKSRIYRARETIHTEVDGVAVTINKGELMQEGHSLFKQIEPFLEPIDEHVKYGVEEATAEPGKKRGA